MHRRWMSFAVVAVALVVGTGAASATSAKHAPHQPKLTPQNSGTTQGLIAVSPVNKSVVWASGRGGTFAVTTDGGATWRSGVVPGAEALQFRDVEGVSDKVAYVLSIGNGTDSRIYKTTNGGSTWSLQFQNQDPNAFFDCFAFWTPKRGFAQSDSVNGQFPVLPDDERADVAEHRRQRAGGASRRVLLRVERHLCRHGGQEQRVGGHRGRIPVQGPRHAGRR